MVDTEVLQDGNHVAVVEEPLETGAACVGTETRAGRGAGPYDQTV